VNARQTQHSLPCLAPFSIQLKWILVVVTQANRAVERAVHIVVLPGFRRGLADGLQAHLIALVLQVGLRDGVGCDGAKITLRSNEHDRRVFADLPDLRPPPLHVLQTGAIVDGDTQHEAIRSVVADLAVDTEVRITAIVVDLQLNLLIFKLFRSTEHIQHVRLVVFVEALLLVIYDHTGLTHGGVAHEDEFNGFGCVRVVSGISWTRARFRFSA